MGLRQDLYRAMCVETIGDPDRVGKPACCLAICLSGAVGQ